MKEPTHYYTNDTLDTLVETQNEFWQVVGIDDVALGRFRLGRVETGQFWEDMGFFETPMTPNHFKYTLYNNDLVEAKIEPQPEVFDIFMLYIAFSDNVEQQFVVATNAERLKSKEGLVCAHNKDSSQKIKPMESGWAFNKCDEVFRVVSADWVIQNMEIIRNPNTITAKANR